MAVLSGVEGLSLLDRLLIFSIMKGALTDVSATVVIGMNNTSALFECSESVTLRCNAGVSFANWQIAYRVQPDTESSAQCYENECYVQNNFTGRYNFTYSSVTGIADLHINPVVIEDDGREYKCNDGTQSPLKATVKHCEVPCASSYGDYVSQYVRFSRAYNNDFNECLFALQKEIHLKHGY